MKSPIGWPGGKTKLAPEIVKHIHATPHKIYVEPFMGSLAVLLAKSPGVSTSEMVNDAHDELTNFFIVVSEKPLAFLHEFRYAIASESYFKHLKDKDPASMSEVARAFRFYYLTKASFGQRYGDNSAIGKESSKTQTRVQMGRLDLRFPKIKQLAMSLQARLQSVVISCRDYKDMADFDGESTLYYLDPPYFDTTQTGYGGTVDLKEFWKWCNSLQGKVIISHEPNKRFDRAFRKWERVGVGTRVTSLSRKKSGRKRVQEYLYFNYDPPIERRSLF